MLNATTTSTKHLPRPEKSPRLSGNKPQGTQIKACYALFFSKNTLYCTVQTGKTTLPGFKKKIISTFADVSINGILTSEELQYSNTSSLLTSRSPSRSCNKWYCSVNKTEAWENSLHFVMPRSLVSPRHDVWGTTAEISYWWPVIAHIWVEAKSFWLVEATFPRTTNPKHYPDLGSNMHQCEGPVTILQRNQW